MWEREEERWEVTGERRKVTPDNPESTEKARSNLRGGFLRVRFYTLALDTFDTSAFFLGVDSNLDSH
jgi:hypothetical protein